MWWLPHLSTVMIPCTSTTTSCRRSRNRMHFPCVLHRSQSQRRLRVVWPCGWWREEIGGGGGGGACAFIGDVVVDWPAKFQEASPNLPGPLLLWRPRRLGHGARVNYTIGGLLERPARIGRPAQLGKTTVRCPSSPLSLLPVDLAVSCRRPPAVTSAADSDPTTVNELADRLRNLRVSRHQRSQATSS